jgi:hypothetical protein
MWHSLERLPLPVLIFAASWLGCVAWSTFASTTQRLSLEFFGYNAWLLFLAALVYGAAASQPNVTRQILSGAIVALDLLLLREAALFIFTFYAPANSPLLQWISEYSPGTESLALYGSLLLPLAIVRASETQTSNANSEPWHSLQTMWRVARPWAWRCLCIAPASAFIGFALATAMTESRCCSPLTAGYRRTKHRVRHTLFKVPHLAAVLTATMFIGIGAKTLDSTAHWNSETHQVLWSNATTIAKARHSRAAGRARLLQSVAAGATGRTTRSERRCRESAFAACRGRRLSRPALLVVLGRARLLAARPYTLLKSLRSNTFVLPVPAGPVVAECCSMPLPVACTRRNP